MSITTIAWVLWAIVTIFGFIIFHKHAYIKWEWKDMWQGIYWGKDAIYVCLIPFLVFVFPRKDTGL
jgi:hypothetical protein